MQKVRPTGYVGSCGVAEMRKGGQSVGIPGTIHLASGVPERYLLTDKTRNWKGPGQSEVGPRSGTRHLSLAFKKAKGDQTREQIVERAVAEDARLEGTAPMADML